LDEDRLDVANCEVVTVRSTTPLEKSLALLISTSYDAAPDTSVQSRVTVWPAENRVSLAGERSFGAGRGPDDVGVGVGVPVGAGVPVGVGVTVDVGLTVSVAVLVTPAPETEIVTTV
jgi:hypothetical protein